MKIVTAKTLVLAAVGAGALLAGCEAPPPEIVQNGYRGLQMQTVYNPKLLRKSLEANVPPEPIPAALPGGPKAKDVYKNVQVLGELTVAEFNRIMVAFTNWVAPKEGCYYCHVNEGFEYDGIYTKVVARRMIQMTQDTNANWKDHVANTGVTCYTCHRGNPVPPYTWVTDPGPRAASGLAPSGQNIASKTVAYAALPYDPFTPFLLNDNDIRIIGDTALPQGNRSSIKQAEWTYGLMMHISQALGVNCTYCHNSRSFYSWDQSAPQRTTAWYAIRHVRALNNDYVVPLSEVLPDSRKGPLGDVYKVYCTTCHQGAYKPLYAAQMLKDYPALAQPLPEGGLEAVKAAAEAEAAKAEAAAAPAEEQQATAESAEAPAPAAAEEQPAQEAAAPAEEAAPEAEPAAAPAEAAPAEAAPSAKPQLRYPPPSMMQYPPPPLQVPPAPAGR
ncbi:MAG: photosynthetic reaction center cytochrome c subunit [Thiohalocapsa sp.]|jgi:photosynthetic reaction center cytochrome c subunit|uniref:photosynthetic reaction center cytochrome PufC n=1 Tax=Thiohalocapsa sp. TaxID=2497641 RepID=UPI0025E46664|nr:photosynthetic reaction center cytochrome PufC [Thiohalocapsa sp.]MCG6939965.1 photosynthetic reaction center cytochrome c subunit [Thiohalocapsa sp.]